MENWSSIRDKPSNEVCVFPGCDFQIRVNGPSPSEQKPETDILVRWGLYTFQTVTLGIQNCDGCRGKEVGKVAEHQNETQK